MEVQHEQQPTGGSANSCTNTCANDTYSLKSEGAEKAVHRTHQTVAIPPDLQRVIDAWPALPTAVRHSLLAISDGVGGQPDEASR